MEIHKRRFFSTQKRRSESMSAADERLERLGIVKQSGDAKSTPNSTPSLFRIQFDKLL
jgi:hypothetical protein